MKKMFPALAAVAIAFSMSAFTTVSENSSKKTDLHWFVYNQANNTLSSYLGEGPRSTFAVDPCDEETGIECRRGYTDDELKNSAIPEQGPNAIGNYEENIYRP